MRSLSALGFCTRALHLSLHSVASGVWGEGRLALVHSTLMFIDRLIDQSMYYTTPLCNLETSGAATPNWVDATGLETLMRRLRRRIPLNKSEK